MFQKNWSHLHFYSYFRFIHDMSLAINDVFQKNWSYIFIHILDLFTIWKKIDITYIFIHILDYDMSLAINDIGCFRKIDITYIFIHILDVLSSPLSFFLSFFLSFQMLCIQTHRCTHRTLHLCFRLLGDTKNFFKKWWHQTLLKTPGLVQLDEPSLNVICGLDILPTSHQVRIVENRLRIYWEN